MTSFSYTVDTDPLAHQMDRVTKDVEVVGGAVTAMQLAVIASEQEASDAICKSLDDGFYMLVRSRFSQRLAQFANTMGVRVGSMVDTANAINRTREQMSGDFHRIKSRYCKLFDKLDRSLEKRIREIDRDALELARKRSALLIERQRKEVPAALLYSTDTQKAALKVSTARVKSRVSSSISSLCCGAQRVIEHNNTMHTVLEQSSTAEPQAVCVPVIYAAEESSSAPGSFFLNVYAPQSLSPDSQSLITAGVRRSGESLIKTSARELAAIRTAYAEKVAAAQLDARTSETMMHLFNASFTANGTPADTSTTRDATATGGTQ
ncbi:MAG: hypothetical protein J6D54_06455 [Olsenella sp.]|nr:hypothetical protein [Olsenella sp.]